MKRILAIIIAALFVVMTLASCTGEYEDVTATSQSTEKATDAATEATDSGNDSTTNNATDKTDSNTNEETKTEDKKEEATEKPTFNVKESTSGLKYELNEDKLSYTVVGKGSATSKAIVIDGHNGLPVTKVGYSAFGNDSTITSVTFGDYVEELDDYAFSMCKGITSIKFGKGMTYLGDFCFRYCEGLTSVEIPSNITVLKSGVFYTCKNLATIKLHNKIRIIEEFTFDKTAYFNNSANWKNKVLYIGTNLIKAKADISGSYTVTSGTTCVGGKAFDACTSLSGVTLPNSVHSIGAKAFNDATSLKTISIGSGVNYIGEKAFTNTKYFKTSDNWSNNVLYIGSYLVATKSGLSGGYSIKDGTRVIADMAFNGCSSITSIGIPDSTVYVGEYAFLGCAKLGSITIGSGVKEIGILAFKDCSSLKNITFKKTSGWSAGKTSVASDILSSKTDAAVYLGIFYSNVIWKHA